MRNFLLRSLIASFIVSLILSQLGVRSPFSLLPFLLLLIPLLKIKKEKMRAQLLKSLNCFGKHIGIVPPRKIAPSSTNHTSRSATVKRTEARQTIPNNRLVTRNSAGWEYQVLPVNAINLPIIKYQIQPLPNMNVCLVELKPQIHKIYDQYYIKRKVVRYLAFPYTAFLIVLYDGQLASLFHYFSSYPINGLGGSLNYSCLSNTDSVGHVCYGDDREWEEINSRLARIPTLRGKIVEIIEEYWRTSFTNHLAETHLRPWGKIDPRIASYENWEKTTQKDPDFILTVPWHRRRAGTVDHLLKYVWR